MFKREFSFRGYEGIPVGKEGACCSFKASDNRTARLSAWGGMRRGLGHELDVRVWTGAEPDPS